jgi:hypothetical protein
MNLLSLVSARKSPAPVQASQGPWPLDTPLIRWSRYARDTWTLQDAMQDVICFGQKGSGKTSASGRLFARKFLQAGFGGIVLCAQQEEAQNWRGYLKDTDREKDGRFFTLDGPHRFNPIAWEAGQSGGVDFSENIVHLVSDVAGIRKKPGVTSMELPFWGEQRERLLRNAIELLLLVGEPVTLSGIHQIVSGVPSSLAEAEDPQWEHSSPVHALLTRAKGSKAAAQALPGIQHYFLKDWPKLGSKERGGIGADLTGLLDPLTRGKLAELFGTTINLSPDDLEEGRVIVIDVPMKHRLIAQYAALLWLQSVYRFASRRTWDPPNTRPLFVFVDETQYYATPADARFQSTSRHHGFSVVRLTQSLPGLRAAYGSQDETDALLSHCCTRIFHLNTCAVTNEWASKSVGHAVQVRQSISKNHQADGDPQHSFAETQDWSCPQEAFLDLKSGGKRHKQIVESIVAQAGRRFLDGRRWIISECLQKKNEKPQPSPAVLR